MSKQVQSQPPAMLLFVATPGEQRAIHGTSPGAVQVVCTGVGPANAAHAARRALEALSPACRPLVAVFGLGGALSPALTVGDIVLGTHTRLVEGDPLPSCPTALARAADCLTAAGFTVYHGDHLTTPYVVCQATEKRRLYEQTMALAVDMESYAIAQVAKCSELPLLLVRIISDDAHWDLPNLNAGLDPDYALHSLRMAAALLSHPFAAARFLYHLRYALMKLRQAASVCLSGLS